MERLLIRRTNTFKKDLKLAIKRGFNIKELDIVIEKLSNREKLDDKYADHALSGDYKGFRECHVKPDWLLIYLVEDKQLRLLLFRTGTHSDLFH